MELNFSNVADAVLGGSRLDIAPEGKAPEFANKLDVPRFQEPQAPTLDDVVRNLTLGQAPRPTRPEVAANMQARDAAFEEASTPKPPAPAAAVSAPVAEAAIPAEAPPVDVPAPEPAAPAPEPAAPAQASPQVEPDLPAQAAEPSPAPEATPRVEADSAPEVTVGRVPSDPSVVASAVEADTTGLYDVLPLQESSVLTRQYPEVRKSAQSVAKRLVGGGRPGSAINHRITGDPTLDLGDIGIPADLMFLAAQNPESSIRAYLVENDPGFDQSRIAEQEYTTSRILGLFTKERGVQAHVMRTPMNRETGGHLRTIIAIPGPSITVHPLLVKQFNADFDGDTFTLSFTRQARAGVLRWDDYLIDIDGKMMVDEDMFTPIPWGKAPETARTRLGQIFEKLGVDATSQELGALGDLLTTGMMKSEGVEESMSRVLRLIVKIAGHQPGGIRVRGDVVSKLLRAIYEENKALLIASVASTGYNDPARIRALANGKIVPFSEQAPFPHQVFEARPGANDYDVRVAMGSPFGTDTKTNPNFRLASVGKNARSRADLIRGIGYAQGRTITDVLAAQMSSVPELDDSAYNVSQRAREELMLRMGSRFMPDVSSREAFRDWLLFFEEHYNTVASSFNAISSLTTQDSQLLEFSDSQGRTSISLPLIRSGASPETRRKDIRTQFYMMYHGFTMTEVFGELAPPGWELATIDDYTHNNRTTEVGSMQQSITEPAVFIMRLADMRTSLARELRNEIVGTAEQEGVLGKFFKGRKNRLKEAVRVLHKEAAAYRQDADTLFRALFLLGPELFESLGVLSTENLIKSKAGQRFIDAANVSEMAAALVSLIIEARTKHLRTLDAKLEAKPGDIGLLTRREYERLALASSSATWRVLMGTDGLIEDVQGLRTIEEIESLLNEIVKNTAGGNPVQESYEILADLVAHPKGQYAGDRFSRDLGHTGIKADIRAATARIESLEKNSFAHWQKEVRKARKHHALSAEREAKGQASKIVAFMERVAADPASLVDIQTWSLIDAALASLQKSYASTEKAQQEAARNYLFSLLTAVHNGVMMADIRVLGDLRFGAVSLETFERSPYLVSRVITDPSFSITVYEGSRRTKLSQAVLFPDGVSDTAVWDWLEANPRAAMALRKRSVGNTVDQAGFSYEGAVSTLSVTIREALSVEVSDEMRLIRDFSDRPSLYAMMMLAEKLTGQRRDQLRGDMYTDPGTDAVREMVLFLRHLAGSEIDVRDYVMSNFTDEAVGLKPGQMDWVGRLGAEQATGFMTIPPFKRTILRGGNPAFQPKDQEKADIATRFIGQGSSGSSTAAYAASFGKLANTGEYSVDDIVFISAEDGTTKTRPGRLDPDFEEIDRAIAARARFVTDTAADRARRHNTGERAVVAYLEENGYEETEPGNGRWVHRDVTIREVPLSKAGTFDVRDSDAYQYWQVRESLIGRLAEHVEHIGRLDLAVMPEKNVAWPFKTSDPASIRAYFDVIQDIRGSRTMISTSVNASQSAKLVGLGYVAQVVPSSCDSDSPPPIETLEFSADWDEYIGRKAAVTDPETGSTVHIPVTPTADIDGTLDRILALSGDDGVVIEDPAMCTSPTCACIRHATVDRTTNTGGQQTTALGRFVQILRDYSTEALNLQVKKAGDDGTDSVVRRFIWERGAGDYEAEVRKVYDPTDLAPARRRLAELMESDLRWMGYEGILGRDDLVNIAQVLIRPAGDDVIVLSLGELSARVDEVIMRELSRSGGSVPGGRAIELVTDALASIELKPLPVSEVFGRVRAGKQIGLGSVSAMLVDKRKSSIARKLELMLQLVAAREEAVAAKTAKPVTTMTAQERGKLYGRLAALFPRQFALWDGYAAVDEKSSYLPYWVIGVFPEHVEGKPGAKAELAYGPRFAWIVDAKSPHFATALSQAYDLGITIFLTGDVDDAKWDEVEAATGIIDRAQVVSVGSGRQMIPMFDIRLNGANTAASGGAVEAGAVHGSPDNVSYYGETVLNVFDLGNSDMLAGKTYSQSRSHEREEEYRVKTTVAFGQTVSSLREQLFMENMDQAITSYGGRYAFLANDHAVLVTYEGRTYPSVEHAMQAARLSDPADRIQFQDGTAGQARKTGSRLESDRTDEELREILFDLLKQKFAPGTEMAQLLLETGYARLSRRSKMKDSVLVDELNGMLALVRSELRGQIQEMALPGVVPPVTVPTKQEVQAHIISKLETGGTLFLDVGRDILPGSGDEQIVQQAVYAYAARFDAEADENGVLPSGYPGEIVGWVKTEWGGTARFHPVRPFERENRSGSPRRFEVDSITVDEATQEIVTRWHNSGTLEDGSFKFFEMNFGTNKYIARAEKSDDIMLANGMPLAGLVSSATSSSRRTLISRTQRMVTLMFMARNDRYGYNVAELEGSFPDDPELREAVLTGSPLSFDLWKATLDELGDRGTFRIFPEGLEHLDAIATDMARKALRYGVDPSIALASRHTTANGDVVPNHMFFNFEMLFGRGMRYQHELMRFFHALVPGLVPDGIFTQEEGDTLFNRDLKVYVTMKYTDADGNPAEVGEWIYIYGGFHFHNEDYSDYSGSGTMLASQFPSSTNANVLGGKRPSAAETAALYGWRGWRNMRDPLALGQADILNMTEEVPMGESGDEG